MQEQADKWKYTAIYVDSWMSGSNMHVLPKMRRVERSENETVSDMLEREGIANRTVFLFAGHPPILGE